jgi:colanic acid/amylovoran biosynthesis glycosyltransferase
VASSLLEIINPARELIMKVAFIVNQFPALSETFILNQITGLIDRAHEVDIYAYRPRHEAGVHLDIAKYNLLKYTYYMTHSMSMPQNKVYRLIKGMVRIARDLHKKPMAVLNSLNPLKYGKDATSLKRLYQITPFLDKGHYDIIHCHFGPIGNFGIFLKDVGAVRGKIVTTFRGYDISSYVEKNGEHIYDTLFEEGNLFLCVSEQIKDILLKLGCDERKIIVHRSGVQLSKFNACKREEKSNDKLQLLTIARLVEKKGVEYGIRAVNKVLKKYPNVEYKIAGDGHLRGSLQNLIEEFKVFDNIKLIGSQSQEQIIAALRETDILLAPSVTSQGGDREGIPGAIVEALASGVPVLSTRHSGIPEVVQDAESGFLVPERDPEALAEKLEYLIENPETRAQMGRKGRKYVEERYDLDKLNDRLVEIYQGLLHGAQSYA